jgi:hypothetical protein
MRNRGRQQITAADLDVDQRRAEGGARGKGENLAPHCSARSSDGEMRPKGQTSSSPNVWARKSRISSLRPASGQPWLPQWQTTNGLEHRRRILTRRRRAHYLQQAALRQLLPIGHAAHR